MLVLSEGTSSFGIFLIVIDRTPSSALPVILSTSASSGELKLALEFTKASFLLLLPPIDIHLFLLTLTTDDKLAVLIYSDLQNNKSLVRYCQDCMGSSRVFVDTAVTIIAT